MRIPALMAMSVITLLLSPLDLAFAQDLDLSGYASLGGRFYEENVNSAKYKEYRTINDGPYGSFGFEADRGGYYLDLSGENYGLFDQSYLLKGGKYDSFKYSLFYNEIPHNLSFGDRTFYSGVGSNNLTFSGSAIPTLNSYQAGTFNYRVNRINYGATLELSLNTPFYFSASVSENDKKGLQPLGAATGTSPGGGFVELPMPVQYYTKNLNVEAGYRTKNIIFSIDGMVSDFDNNNSYLFWRNPSLQAAVPPIQASSIAPNSDYWRIGGKMLVRLPLDSALTLKGSYAKAENNLYLARSFINIPAATVSSTNFNGDVTYTSLSVDLTTHPVSPLDVRLFYNYFDKGNDSSVLTFTNTATGTTSQNDIYSYSKQDAGFDVGYRFLYNTKVNTGYEYTRINRPPAIRPDAVNTTDNKVYVQVKNSFFDFLTARITYQHLARRSLFDNELLPADPDDEDVVLHFFKLFDATTKNENLVKVNLELTPLENLALGLEYAYKLNDYNDTFLGRTKDKRQEFYFDAEYTWPEMFKVSGYFDYEYVITDSLHRSFVQPPNSNGIPTNPPTFTNYNWANTIKDKNYAYGFGVEVPVIKNKLDVVAAWGYEKASGKTEFAAQQNSNVSLVNISNYDDYTKKAINAKVIYKVSKNLDLTAGYAYEKYFYNDAEYQGYLLFVPASSPVNNNYLTGAYADHDYEASLWFLSATYRF